MSIYDKDTDLKGAFLSICPRDSKYMDWNVVPVTLRVVQDSGVNYVPDVNIQVNDLASGDKHFQNNSGKGDTFKVDVLITSDDSLNVDKTILEGGTIYGADIGAENLANITWSAMNTYYGNVSISEMLDYWIKKMIPVNVVTRAIDVPNGLYIIKDNSSRKQSHEKSSIWTLEFIKFEQFTYTAFSKTNAGVTTAIKKYEKAKAKAKKKQAQAKLTTTQKLKNCGKTKLVYSKKKKVVTCVKYLQEILNKKGCKPNLKKDGWFGKDTTNAVKDFQKKNKSYGLKQTGKVDQNTFNCLIGKCGQVGKTKTIKSNLPAAGTIIKSK